MIVGAKPVKHQYLTRHGELAGLSSNNYHLPHQDVIKHNHS